MKKKSDPDEMDDWLANFAAVVAHNTETQTQTNKFHTKGGTGFAAEDANALNDRLHGVKVEKTGLTNELNGADRIADGIPIQSTYFSTARQSVNAAFHPETGHYKYAGQQLEVPRGQGSKARRMMRNKIIEGKVFNTDGTPVTNPAEAKNIIREGSVTYQQAKNIAKAGNIDSLAFDVKNNCITDGSTLGIAFVFEYALRRWNGETPGDAAFHALGNAVRTAANGYVGSVIASQILRTKVAAQGTHFARHGVKAMSHTPLGKTMIQSLASASTGRTIAGAAAMNHVAKLLRSNVITGAVITAVVTAPDVYRAAVNKSMSWEQVGKNLFVNTTGLATGTAGWAGGMTAGAAVGSAVPVVGTVVGGITGGIIGALGAGVAGSVAAKKLADQFCEDDAKKMWSIIQEEVAALASEYCFNESEILLLSKKVQKTCTAAWLRKMFAYTAPYRMDLASIFNAVAADPSAVETVRKTDSKKQFVRKVFEPYCGSLLSKRPKIQMPEERQIVHELEKFLPNFVPVQRLYETI
ncbi:MAG: hypothetical protein LBH00_02970 [Planctomycetaceae bacterium]|jgi:hypothetical protein|nr:hypothetical protein [Planctomycetaceae bacterium]